MCAKLQPPPACAHCTLFLPCLCAVHTTAVFRVCPLYTIPPLPVKQEEQHAADVVPCTRRAPTTLATRGGRQAEWQALQRCDQGLREVVREVLLLSTVWQSAVPRGVRCVAVYTLVWLSRVGGRTDSNLLSVTNTVRYWVCESGPGRARGVRAGGRSRPRASLPTSRAVGAPRACARRDMPYRARAPRAAARAPWRRPVARAGKRRLSDLRRRRVHALKYFSWGASI